MAHIEWLRTVFDDGMHNAFTDLAYWRGHYYISFRRAEAHRIFPRGGVFVIRSRDLESWEVCASITTGLDDRDPKMAVDGDRLWVFFGAWRFEVDREMQIVGDRTIESFASCTTDGTTWSTPQAIYEPRWWLWRPMHCDDGFYCAAYAEFPGEGKQGFMLDLLRSEDGLQWSKVCPLVDDGTGDETGLLRFDDGRMLAVVRTTGSTTLIMESPGPPYTQWQRWEVDHWIHAPVVAQVGDRLVTVGRFDAGDRRHVTRLWQIRDHATELLLELPSGGDNSYCGMHVEDENTLLISYYSQHTFLDAPGFQPSGKPAAIHLAKICFDVE